MKQNDPIGKNEPLGRILQEWQVDASLPPRFQEDVWRRIARSEGSRENSWWKDFLLTCEAAFRRPALAVSYVAILLVIGLSVGIAQARHSSARLDETLGTRYVQSIDPYQAHRH